MRQTPAALLLACLVIVLSGCGKEREPYKKELVQVTGTVKISDKPLGDATVTFAPIGSTKGLGASGKTDANGVYTLTTPYAHPGILPGEYRVTVSKRVDPKTGEVKTSGALKELVPAQYSTPGTSALKLTVPAGGGTLDIPLKN